MAGTYTSSNADHEPITLRGLIVPADWDEKGKVVSVAISTFDEEEYVLDDDETAKGLLKLMRQEVVIIGVVREIGGKKCLTVKSYDLMNLL